MSTQWGWGIVYSSTWGTRALERHLDTATRRTLGHLGTQVLGHWGTRTKCWTLPLFYSRHSVSWAPKLLSHSIQQTPFINMNISNNSRKYIAKEIITKKLSFVHNTNKECITVKQWHFVKLSLLKLEKVVWLFLFDCLTVELYYLATELRKMSHKLSSCLATCQSEIGIGLSNKGGNSE